MGLPYVSPRVLVRQRADRVLSTAQLLRGVTVEQTRSIPIDETRLPFVTFYASEEQGENDTPGASPPRALTTVPLHVICRVKTDSRPACERELDRIVDGIKDLLLTSAVFMASPVLLSRVDVVVKIDGTNDAFIGDGIIKMDLVVTEEFVPVATTPLAKIAFTIAPFGMTASPYTLTVTLPNT